MRGAVGGARAVVSVLVNRFWINPKKEGFVWQPERNGEFRGQSAIGGADGGRDEQGNLWYSERRRG